MRSLGKGVMSATMRKREGVEPRNNSHCIGPRVSFPGSQYRYVRNGECISTCRGLSPWRANELSILELGRTEAFRMEAAKELKK